MRDDAANSNHPMSAMQSMPAGWTIVPALLGFVIVAAAQVSNVILGMWQLSHQVGGAASLTFSCLLQCTPGARSGSLSAAELRGRRRQLFPRHRPPRRVAMASASGQSRNVDSRSGFVNNDVEALVESRRDEIVRE
jgi:hypothetical protein